MSTLTKFEEALHPRDSHGKFTFTPDRAKQFVGKHYGSWHQGLSYGQRNAVERFQSPHGHEMNAILRGDPVAHSGDDFARLNTSVEDMKSAIDSAPPLDSPITTFRALSSDELSKLSVGSVMKDHGFAPVSLVPDVEVPEHGAIVEITLPVGTRAAAGSLHDLTLPADSQFQVTNAIDKDGKPYVIAHLVSTSSIDTKVSIDQIHDVVPTLTADDVRSTPTMQVMLNDRVSKYMHMQDDQDGILSEIAKIRGFDAYPQLSTAIEVQTAIDSGQPDMWRSMWEDAHVEQFKTGAYFAGGGIFGNGTYALAATEPRHADEVKSEGAIYGPKQVHMTMKTDANMITLDEIHVRQEADVEKLKEERMQLRALINAEDDLGHDVTALEDQLDALREWGKVIADPGRWAAVNGYDAYIVGNGRWGAALTEMVVLNRGSLLVENE